ncbi:MAG TPA: Fe-S oxidoreductase [Chromatiaceae bacterium]|mgnify:FL=1|jgi:glycerol-3-phosphate dehydrogenase subunit C|nr:MAG: Fe-S oxidoreductase [Thiohalocapsa sp. PB-PSB1]QQO52579.1 MAG: Fe-S oxidoreductase [Thiohalocapsa sp. PB-PSB1]HBG93869.1 Fe-S oxidoreductase [Chromatiaceae bacterium]HCS90259.1 Fe-S oxidoreductase [Chromatiaceae bacterium]
MSSIPREGSLEAPIRYPLDWRSTEFYDQDALNRELERVFDICHGCRRCVSLCQAFPTLFDLVDESESMEIDSVDKKDFFKVVDHCYLCDLCYMTKCPYVPPHEWGLDFPHLMLRAKAVNYRSRNVKTRDKLLTSTDLVGSLASIPVISGLVNTTLSARAGRKLLQATLGVEHGARLPVYHSDTLRRRRKGSCKSGLHAEAAGPTTGKVALFATCYGNYNEPDISEDLIAVFEHNRIPVTLALKERCCGMPKLELGDLNAVEKAKQANIPLLKALVDEGWDLVAPVPSCVLMFKQELPLMFPDDADVQAVREHFFDPFEYLMLRHKHAKLNTAFKQSLGKVIYQASCHQRVQNIGQKTRELLALVPNTTVEIIERCSGHDGTYAVKTEFHAASMKIVGPVAKRVQQADADHFGSDCPMAGAHIAHALNQDGKQEHPLSLIRAAYGI